MKAAWIVNIKYLQFLVKYINFLNIYHAKTLYIGKKVYKLNVCCEKPWTQMINISFIMLPSSIAEKHTVRVAGEKLAFKHACA